MLALEAFVAVFPFLEIASFASDSTWGIKIDSN